jgi:hypothetical protein
VNQMKRKHRPPWVIKFGICSNSIGAARTPTKSCKSSNITLSEESSQYHGLHLAHQPPSVVTSQKLMSGVWSLSCVDVMMTEVRRSASRLAMLAPSIPLAPRHSLFVSVIVILCLLLHDIL